MCRLGSPWEVYVVRDLRERVVNRRPTFGRHFTIGSLPSGRNVEFDTYQLGSPAGSLARGGFHQGDRTAAYRSGSPLRRKVTNRVDGLGTTAASCLRIGHTGIGEILG
jgi:hypothetical protein